MNTVTTPYQPHVYGYRQYASTDYSARNIALSESPPVGPTTTKAQPPPIQTNPTLPEISSQQTEPIFQGPSVTPSKNNPYGSEISSQNEEATTPDSGLAKGNNAAKPVSELSPESLQLLDELQKADAEVKTHEMAHIAAGGQYVTSGAQLSYIKGPDGQNYAVAGEVSIDTSPIPGDPQATLAKMRQIQRAALAPASPSNQDRKVASRASAMAAQALSEMMVQQVKSRVASNEDEAFGPTQRQAADNYAQINTAPMMESKGNRLDIAV